MTVTLAVRYRPGPEHKNQHVSNWTNSRFTRQRSPTPIPERSSNPSTTIIPDAIQQLDNFVLPNHSSVKRSSVKHGAGALDKQANSVPAPQRKILTFLSVIYVCIRCRNIKHV